MIYSKEGDFYLRDEFFLINEKLKEITNVLEKFNNKLNNFELKINQLYNESKEKTKTKTNNPTIQHINSTDSRQTDNNSTHNLSFKGLKTRDFNISSGNEGVPTDRQTDQQTDKLNNNLLISTQNNIKNNLETQLNTTLYTTNNIKETPRLKNNFEELNNILNSLDTIKKDIRLKFKKLTEQEFLVFSTMYQLDEEIGYSNYKLISERLNLTESSIRDYIGRLIKKGIPVDKIKINNKTINLNISKNLKQIATLSTILQLREL